MRQIGGLKRCPRCTVLLPVSAFGPDHHQTDGYALYCRPCSNARKAAVYVPRPPRSRVCRECGQPFEHSGRGPIAVHCDPCREATCAACGCTFLAKGTRPNRRCSECVTIDRDYRIDLAYDIETLPRYMRKGL